MKIIIVNHVNKKISSRRLGQALDAIVAILVKKKIRNKKLLLQKKEIVFIFLNKLQMQKVNSQYRKKNYPTDILSFEAADESCLGELVFCLPVLKKQALRLKHSQHAELTYMIIHGVLHLLGYDHEKSKPEEKRMFAIQDTCFAQLQHLKSIF